MIKVEIIGNLGADAMLQEKNGNRFVAFRVANTDKWVDKATGQVIESTQWISCTLNGDGGALLPYLKRGTKVFVRGNAQFVVFSSAKTRQMEVGVNLFVREIELCGGAKEESTATTTASANSTATSATAREKFQKRKAESKY